MRGLGRQGIAARFDGLADDLGVVCVRALLARTRFDPATIEDVIFGCANQGIATIFERV